MLSEKIRERTSEQHQRLEKILVSRLKAVRKTDDLAEILQVFYAYFSRLENKIKAFIDHEDLRDLDDRRKSKSIENDLHYFQHHPDEKITGELPSIADRPGAFGTMYVMEGSTLGGRVISGMMKKQLSLAGDEGLSFFSGYGGRTAEMWTKFKEAMNRAAQNPEEEEKIIAAANETFRCFGTWFGQFLKAT